MKKKLKFITSLFFLGLGIHASIYAANNELAQYESFLEPEDDIIITEKVETISYSRNSSGISATRSVKAQYMNRRYGANHEFQIYYNQEDSKLTNIKSEHVSYFFSSNLDNNGIFFDGLNICNCETNLKDAGGKANFAYDQNYNNALYLSKAVFAESEFIGKHTIIVEVPSWLNMEIKEFNFNGKVTKTTKPDDKKNTYTYTMENVKPLREESHTQPPLYTFPSLLFVYKSATLSNDKEMTLFSTAQDQYQWYNQLMAQIVENTDSICKETHKIVAHSKDDYEKVASLYQWVQKNIRYIAFENGIAGFKPQLASKVLDDKYGDCKGMANLLRNMLRCEGIDSRMVWLGTNTLPYDYSTPSLAVDNHAICATIIGRDTIYLDATCEYAAMKEYPSSIAGRPVMMENGNNCILTHVPDNHPHDNLDSTYISMSITDKGLEGKYKNIQRGEDKIKFLYYFNDDFSDILKSLQRRGFQGLPPNNEQVELSGVTAADSEVVVEYPYIMEKPVVKSDNKYYISMDITHRFLSLETDEGKKKTNLYFNYKAVDACTSELTIPSGYKVTYKPADLKIDKQKYKFEIKYELTGNKILYKRSITLKEQTIPLEQLSEWNKDLEKLKSAYLEMLILEK
ncbi:MAG: DUF3858 domain-containing protein [Paludibacteraceae bacterium]|nr:DUF3858 domain-containing protein [Paludibacteraceae bacterium]